MLTKGFPLDKFNGATVFSNSALDLGGKHTEENTLYNLFGPKSATNSIYFGMIKLWAARNMLSVPLISATALQGNVMYTNGIGSQLGFSLPYRVGLPFVKENVMKDNPRPGLNGTKAQLVLSENCFTGGDIITWDFQNAPELRVSRDEEIVPYGDGWLYHVELANRNALHDYIPQYAFQPSLEYAKITNDLGEFDIDRSSISKSRWGMAHYHLELGSATRGVETWITQNADILEVSSSNTSFENLAFWGDMRNPQAILNLMNWTGEFDKTGKKIPDLRSLTWTPMIIAQLYKEMALMEERDLTWGKPREGYDARGKKYKTGIGYWQQLKAGNYIPFTDNRQLLSILKNVSADLFAGSNLPLHQRKIRVKVGSGAMMTLQREFQAEYKANNIFLVLAQNINGLLTGNNMNLRYAGYRFTSFVWPEIGEVELEYTPALDNRDDGSEFRSQSSLYGHWDERSYTIIIEDVTEASFSNRKAGLTNGQYSTENTFDNGANLVMIKPSKFRNINASHIIGTHCPDVFKAYYGYPADQHPAVTKDKGFGIILDSYSQVWMKDPTRSVLIEKVDPLKYYY